MHEALTCNPYDSENVCEALDRALSMSEDERVMRMMHLRRREEINDVDFWLHSFLRYCIDEIFLLICTCMNLTTPDHLLWDSAPNLGPLISRWEINKFENCLYKSVRILEVLKLLI
jgi:hypothetical protein